MQDPTQYDLADNTIPVCRLANILANLIVNDGVDKPGVNLLSEGAKLRLLIRDNLGVLLNRHLPKAIDLAYPKPQDQPPLSTPPTQGSQPHTSGFIQTDPTPTLNPKDPDDPTTGLYNSPLIPPTRGPGSQPHTSTPTDPTPAPPPNPSGASPSLTLLDDLVNSIMGQNQRVWIPHEGWLQRDYIVGLIKPILDKWNTSSTDTYDPSLGSLPQQLRDTQHQLDTARRELALLRELLAIRS